VKCHRRPQITNEHSLEASMSGMCHAQPVVHLIFGQDTTVLFKTKFAVWFGLVKSVFLSASLVASNLIYGFLNTLWRQMTGRQKIVNFKGCVRKRSWTKWRITPTLS
jgi:hypothetical protein